MFALFIDEERIQNQKFCVFHTLSFMFDIAAKIAEIRGTSVERIAEITYCNELKLFNIEGR